jgi:hypothetical protein
MLLPLFFPIRAIEEWEDIVCVSHEVNDHQGINKSITHISKVGNCVVDAQSHGIPRVYIEAYIGNHRHCKTEKAKK